MLSWKKGTTISEPNVTSAANAAVKLDLPEYSYLLKLSAAGWDKDSYELEKDQILRLFV